MKVNFGKTIRKQDFVSWYDLTGGLWRPVGEDYCVILVAEDDYDCRIYIDTEGTVQEPCRWEDKEFVRFDSSITLENDE